MVHREAESEMTNIFTLDSGFIALLPYSSILLSIENLIHVKSDDVEVLGSGAPRWVLLRVSVIGRLFSIGMMQVGTW